MVECGRHLNVELLTLCEIVDVAGEAGDFTVTVKKRPRYIDMDKCIACGICAEKCPKKVDDEYNAGISKRKAAYIKYGQTVPLKYVIDPDNCIYLKKGKCRACEKFCPTGAINFDDKEELVKINVGSVILSPGYTPFDPSNLDFYGYGKYPDVVTSLEYERLLSAGGPCMGHLVRPSDGREPRKIAWIQCVGSRNTNRTENGFCSSVCCMYAMKQTRITIEHMVGKKQDLALFYMDIRSHGKEFERYYNDTVEKGVRFIRARPHTINPGKNNMGVQMGYVTESGEKIEEDFDMVVLSIGLCAPKDAVSLSSTFGFDLNHYNFAKTTCFDPVKSSKQGVFVGGTFRSAKAIPRSVTEASAAAAEAAIMLSDAKNSLTKNKVYPDETDVSSEEPRIGVFVCSCGINIANVVNVAEVVDYAKRLPYVVFAENNLFTCSTDSQVLITQKIHENKLNRIVVAACSPRTHEPLFQDTLREAGLNGFLFEMANIRNHNSWVHQKEPEKATIKAKDQVRMAVAKVTGNYSLTRMQVNVVQKAMVVGGGLSGMTAALAFGNQGYDTVLVEKSDKLGGNAWELFQTYKGENIRERLESMIDAVNKHPKITLLKNTTVKSCSGSVGNFTSELLVNGSSSASTNSSGVGKNASGTEIKKINYGVSVIATGGKSSTTSEYLFGKDDRVMTPLKFDEYLSSSHTALKEADTVVFIQCVGSREPNRPYCSRLCCTHSVKSAILLKQINPELNVYILNRDIRTYGEREDLYRQARDAGVIFIKYELDRKPNVYKKDNEVVVEAFDPILTKTLRLFPDYLILATGIEANDSKDLMDIFKFGINEDGFLNEAHPKLRPVDMPVDGLFVAGLCNYPKPVEESITQALACVSRAGVILAKQTMELDAIKSYITEKCDGCAVCIDVCPYMALKLEEYQLNGSGRVVKRVKADPALCKGCGLCQAVCPKGGIMVHGFTLPQLKAQVDAALESII